MGPLVSAGAARPRGRLRRSGARLRRRASLLGGDTNGHGAKGFFYDPTVVTDIDQDSEIIQQEVFGPVVTVQRFNDDDEAIRWANGVPYGLASIGLDARRQACAQRRPPAALRHGVDQRPPDDRLGDAARRFRPERLRQGHEQLLDRGLHDRQARHGQDQLGCLPMRSYWSAPARSARQSRSVAADREWLEHDARGRLRRRRGRSRWSTQSNARRASSRRRRSMPRRPSAWPHSPESTASTWS